MPGAVRQRWQSRAAIALFVLIGLLSLWSLSPPAPLGLDAPAEDFSAARARVMLRRILGDGRPHPTGSAANAAVRERIVAELERLGYRPEVQRRFVCSELGPVCANVHNVIARLPGTGDGPGVLLAAHYDSVAAGPGAGDDGAGIAAILEIARALEASSPLPRTVWFLLGDGEEAGLLDAEAFVREPEFEAIGSVINLEARGTSGPSQLFETQTGNAMIVALAAGALTHPVGSSLAYEIYKHMPNNTDFTVFRREGLAGVNFAFTGGPARYHTPRDSLTYLDAASIQHHGENALAMVRALARAPAVPRAEHDRVFFDLFASVLVSWPTNWNVGLLAVTGIAWLLLAVRLARRRALRSLALVLTCLFVPVALAVALGLALGLQWALAHTAPAASAWTAQGGMLIPAFMALAVAVCTALARPLARRWGDAALSLAALFVFLLIALVTLPLTPGASYLALLPLSAGALAGHLRPSRPVFWGAAAAVFTAALWLPFAWLTYEALGFSGLPSVTVLMLLALLPLSPALAESARGLPLTLAALLALATLIAIPLFRPAFTEAVPRPLNLLYVSDGESGRVLMEAVAVDDERTSELIDAGHFDPASGEVLPWSRRRYLAGQHGPALPAPELTVLQDEATAGTRRLVLSLRTRRDARVLYLVLPESAANHGRVTIEGVHLGASTDDSEGWAALEIIAPSDGKARITIDLPTLAPLSLYAADFSDGLPSAFAGLARTRDTFAVPIDSGDRSAAWREVELPAAPPP